MEQENKQVAKQELNAEIMNKIVLKGDISGLNDAEKLKYYAAMCDRLGIDPLTQPFQIIKFAGQGNKEVLYCTKGGAEQLNKAYKVSHEIKKKELDATTQIYSVEVRASLPDRFIDEVGAVDVKNLFGNNLVNAMLKAVTKAKRRATLSLLGLGMLDETEVDTIQDAKKIDIHAGGAAAKANESKETERNVPDKGIKSYQDKPPTGNPFSKPVLAKCADCGAEIKSDLVLRKSVEEFGVPVCFKFGGGGCQDKRRDKAKGHVNLAKKEVDADFAVSEEGFYEGQDPVEDILNEEV